MGIWGLGEIIAGAPFLRATLLQPLAPSSLLCASAALCGSCSIAGFSAREACERRRAPLATTATAIRSQHRTHRDYPAWEDPARRVEEAIEAIALSSSLCLEIPLDKRRVWTGASPYRHASLDARVHVACRTPLNSDRAKSLPFSCKHIAPRGPMAEKS